MIFLEKKKYSRENELENILFSKENQLDKIIKREGVVKTILFRAIKKFKNALEGEK